MTLSYSLDGFLGHQKTLTKHGTSFWLSEVKNMQDYGNLNKIELNEIINANKRYLMILTIKD